MAFLRSVKPKIAEPCIAKDMYCYGSKYAIKTYYESPSAAFATLKSDYSTDPFVQSQCHQLVHIIGRTAYKKYTELPAVFANGDSFCWSGYFHGVIEQAIGTLGTAKIKEQINTLCSSFSTKNQYSFDHFNCVHGLGHGIMTVEGFDVFKALETCSLLSGVWEQQSCQGGTYMENVMVASRENGHSDFLKQDDLLYPCNAVESRFKQQCYLMQTSYMLQQNNYDFAATFKLCARADKGYESTCYQSIGRDASGSTTSNITGTVAKCRLATTDNGILNCMTGAARDFVSYYHSDVKAKELCTAFGKNLEQPCLEIVETYYANF